MYCASVCLFVHLTLFFQDIISTSIHFSVCEHAHSLGQLKLWDCLYIKTKYSGLVSKSRMACQCFICISLVPLVSLPASQPASQPAKQLVCTLALPRLGGQAGRVFYVSTHPSCERHDVQYLTLELAGIIADLSVLAHDVTYQMLTLRH